MAVSLLRIFKNFENINQLFHSRSWQMLEYGFLKMCKLRFTNCFKVMCLHGAGEKKSKSEHRASLLLSVSHKAPMNSPIFLPVSFTAGPSEKYLLFPGLVFLTSVTPQMIPLEIQVDPTRGTCPFPDDCSLGAASDVPAVYYVWVGGLAMSHTQNTPLSEKGRH